MALKLFKYNLSVRLLSTTSSTSLIDNLSKSNIAKYLGNIDELLTAAPELVRYPTEQFEKSFYTLRKAGFNSLKFAHMISQHPRILIKAQDKIEAATNQWRSLNFGDKPTYQLLERYPELLDIKNFHLITSNLSVINSFVGQKNGYKVLRNSPNIATEPTEMIKEKVEYLRDVMKVDPVEVYKSDVFSHDLLTIKTRHIFLERLGMYFKKRKSDNNNDAHEINKNPKLSKIMDTSDKRFATKVCHVTLDEYETFIEMYKGELEKSGRYDDQFELDDDIDEESQNQYKKRW